MNATQAAPRAPGGKLARWVPALDWLRAYERGWLVPDLLAGLTLAAYAIPAGIADASLAQLPPDQATVVYCHHGVRSAAVAEYLRQRGFARVLNLRGGIDAWARAVDRSMRRY